MADNDVVYGIADTHLGLREKGGKQSRDDPVTVAAFLNWLARVPEAGVPIPVLGASGVEPRTLKRPTHLILLGDILEMWDSENQTLLLSAAAVLPSLAGFPAKMVYVLGNHDNILAISSGDYPIAAGALEMLPETFPPAAPDGTVTPLQIGAASYVFLHGHQLDRFFLASRGTWRWLGHVRQIGAAMGSYAWLFSALGVVTAGFLFTVAPGAALWFLILALVLLVFPRAYMTVARPLYDLRGLKYRRAAARDGFRKWWSRFRANVADPEGLAVVYGHTHVLDCFHEGPAPEETVPSRGTGGRAAGAPQTAAGRSPDAYNISSWVVAKGGYETVTRATFLYADKAGPLFLGWDWDRGGPFHIPFEWAALRGDRRFTASESERAADLRWPAPLIKKWSNTDEKVRGSLLRKAPRRRRDV